jgi:hypothetical protein
MSEAISSNPSKAGRRWLHIATRILVAVIIFIAAVGSIVNVAGVVGVWIVRAPARSDVTDVTATMTHALAIVDNGLARVNNLAQDARQTLTRVNDAAAKLGDRIQASSPLVTGLSQRVDNDLAPRLENLRTTASGIHDAVVTVNSTLMALNRIPGLTVPTLSNELGSVSEHAQEAQAAVQDLRATLAEMKAGLVTKAEAAVTQLTARIDSTQARISSTSNTLLLLIDVLAVSLTLLFAIFAAGLVLLIYVCWQYVRTGHFPSLHVVRTS